MNGVPMLYRTTRTGARAVSLQGAVNGVIAAIVAAVVVQLMLDLHRLGVMRMGGGG